MLPQELKDSMNNINERVDKLTGVIGNYNIAYQRVLLSQKNYRYYTQNRLCDMFSSLTKGTN